VQLQKQTETSVQNLRHGDKSTLSDKNIFSACERNNNNKNNNSSVALQPGVGLGLLRFIVRFRNN
jgi:hypothetical protein